MSRFIIIFAAIILSSCGSEPAANSPETLAKIKAATEAIKKEPRVKDFYYDDLSIMPHWNVGVIPTKSSEYSFAARICDIILDHDIDHKGQVVRVVDITKLMREKVPPKAASLKRIKCEDYMELPE